MLAHTRWTKMLVKPNRFAFSADIIRNDRFHRLVECLPINRLVIISCINMAVVKCPGIKSATFFSRGIAALLSFKFPDDIRRATIYWLLVETAKCPFVKPYQKRVFTVTYFLDAPFRFDRDIPPKHICWHR